MLTILWDNDGVLVDTEGLYFRASQQVLRSVGVPLTAGQFKDISLRRGVSCFVHVQAIHGNHRIPTMLSESTNSVALLWELIRKASSHPSVQFIRPVAYEPGADE